eukprot:scaffold131655_cov57-Phaeocystis_antarctica.AAC.1
MGRRAPQHVGGGRRPHGYGVLGVVHARGLRRRRRRVEPRLRLRVVQARCRRRLRRLGRDSGGGGVRPRAPEGGGRCGGGLRGKGVRGGEGGRRRRSGSGRSSDGPVRRHEGGGRSEGGRERGRRIAHRHTQLSVHARALVRRAEADLAVVGTPAVEGGVAHPCTARVLGSGRRRKLVRLRSVAHRAGGTNAQQQRPLETHGAAQSLIRQLLRWRGGRQPLTPLPVKFP